MLTTTVLTARLSVSEQVRVIAPQIVVRPKLMERLIDVLLECSTALADEWIVVAADEFVPHSGEGVYSQENFFLCNNTTPPNNLHAQVGRRASGFVVCRACSVAKG